MTTSTLGRLAPRPAPRVEPSPRWVRPGLFAVLLLAAVLYGWGLSGSGYANEYYSAAVKSGTESWKAFFFGSLDSASFITVDKPPMALWVQELSARIFGFGTWSLLLPSVLMGVATVGVLYATVRRAFGPLAGLIAALVMTLTPITVAINRDNNPDTLLVLLLVLSVWALQRALTSGRLPWLMASAFFLGCAFNTKMLQAYLVLPALVLVYALFAPGGFLRRIVRLLVAGVVLAVSSFWWMVVVDLIPASHRPYIGGSTNNTVWDLVIGYNGLGRVTGGFGGSGSGPGSGSGGFGGPGRGGQGASFAGASGPGRLFNDIVGGQISWLLPFAAFALVMGMILLWRRPRTDLARAALVLWGGWLAVHFVVFSFSSGTMHPYYTTALTPAVAALTGIGGVLLYDAYRHSRAWSWALPLGIALTGAWSFGLLRRTPEWHPWLAWTVAALTLITTAALVAVRLTSGTEPRARDPHTMTTPELADAEGGPSDTPETTAPANHAEPTPTTSGQADPEQTTTAQTVPAQDVSGQVGPAQTAPSRGVSAQTAPGQAASSRSMPVQAVPGQAVPGQAVPSSAVPSRAGSSTARRLTVVAVIVGLLAGLIGPAAYAASAAAGRTNGTNPLAGPASGGFGMGGPGMPGGGQPPAAIRRMMEEGRFPDGPGAAAPGTGEAGRGGRSSGTGGPVGAGPGQRTGPPGGGGPGMGEVDSQLISYLEKNRDGATWLVAVASAQSASSIILRTGLPVMAMGGFTGSDPAMTTQKLQSYVRTGELRYVLTGGGGPGGGPGGGGTSSVTSWVSKNCSAVKASDYGTGSASAQNSQTLYRCG